MSSPRKIERALDDTTWAWLILLLATGLAWWLGQAHRAGAQGGALATAGVLVVAFFKAWLVGFQFMELRHAPRWLRHAFDGWIAAVCLALVVICLG